MDAKIDGFIGEEYMKMQDDQIRELFQQKLSGHESAVDPALWNSIQSGISGTASGSGVAGGSFISKLGTMKLVAAIAGIVAVGGIIVYQLVSNEPIESPQVAVVEQNQIIADPIEESIPDSNSSNSEEQNLSSAENEIVENEKIEGIIQESSKEPLTTPPSYPFQPKNTNPETTPPNIPLGDTKPFTPDNPVQDSNNEAFTTEFSVVGPNDMGLTKMLIPVYTKASGYRWVINHGETIYEDLSVSHDFIRSGEHHIRLEIEKSPDSGFTEFNEKTICVCARAEVNIEYDLFTPNGDNYSKVFDPMIDSRNIIPIRLLIIDKSSGIQVFEGLNDEAKWNGKGAFGQDYPAGQYFYQFSATDLCGKKLLDKTGFIRLER